MKFTNQTKTELIQRLIVAIEQKQISWPGGSCAPRAASSTWNSEPGTWNPAHFHWQILTDELRRFEYAVTSSGAITYKPPAGFRDGFVIALSLANN